MTVKLINKGGFRERANRHHRYAQSENQQTTLEPNTYQHTKKEQSVQDQLHLSETTSAESKPIDQITLDFKNLKYKKPEN